MYGYAGRGGPCYIGPGRGLRGTGGLTTQALVVKTPTLGIDLIHTKSRGVVCREF